MDPGLQVLHRLHCRDVLSTARAVLGFVREDRLFAHYLCSVGTYLRQDAGEYQSHASAVQRVERGLRELLERSQPPPDPQSFGDFIRWRIEFQSELNRLVKYHRIIHVGLRTGSDQLGLLSSAPQALHRNLRRSVAVSQRVLDDFAADVEWTTSRLFPGSSVPAGLETVVSFDHMDGPEVSTRSATAESTILMIGLPYWFAVRHRHLAALAHESFLAWLKPAWENGTEVRRLVLTPQQSAKEIIEELLLESESFPEERLSEFSEGRARAYVRKMTADALSYCCAGPAYLFSLLTYLNAVRGPADPVDLRYLPPYVRIRCVLEMQRRDFSDAPEGSWEHCFADIADAIGQRLQQYRSLQIEAGASAEARIRFEDGLVESLLPICERAQISCGGAWSVVESERSGLEPDDLQWEHLDELLESLGRSENWAGLANYRLDHFAKWRPLFDRTHARSQIVPSFLWGLAWDIEVSVPPESLRRPVPLGQIAHRIWSSYLRPDRDVRLPVLDFFELRFFRAGPGADWESYEPLLACASQPPVSTQGLLAARLLGSWDSLSVHRHFSSNVRAPFPPVVPESPLYCEPHIAGRIDLSGTSLYPSRREGSWWEELLAGDSQLAITQILVPAEGSIWDVLHWLGDELQKEPAESRPEVVIALASLGWEDLILFWKFRNTGAAETLSRVLTRRGSSSGPPMKYSSTQLLLTPKFWWGTKSETREAEPNVPLQLRVRLTGVSSYDVVEQIRSRSIEIPSLPALSVQTPFGDVDVLIQASVRGNAELVAVRSLLDYFAKNSAALRTDVVWHPVAGDDNE